MPRPYSMDLRERVIEAIAAGASRRETAEQFGLSASVVIIWAQRHPATEILHPSEAADLCHRCVTAGRARGIYPGLIKQQPDMTLDEIVLAMKKPNIAVGRTPV